MDHIEGWPWWEVLPELDPEMRAKMATKARGRCGILVTFFQYWPYALIAIGGFIVYNSYWFIPAVRN